MTEENTAQVDTDAEVNQDEIKDEQEQDNQNNENQENQEEVNPNAEYFGKPEKYDYSELQLPEGMTLNKDTTEKLNGFIDKFDMSQKGANELMSLAIEHTQGVQKQLEQAFAQAIEAEKASYKEALNKDKEIGGAKLKESLSIANEAYEKFASDDYLKLMEEKGLNNHPAVVKVFYQIGKLVKDDDIHAGGNPPKEDKPLADLMYGNKKEND